LLYSTARLALQSLASGAKTQSGLPLFPLQVFIPVGLLILLLPLLDFTVLRWVRLVRRRG